MFWTFWTDSWSSLCPVLSYCTRQNNQFTWSLIRNQTRQVNQKLNRYDSSFWIVTSVLISIKSTRSLLHSSWGSHCLGPYVIYCEKTEQLHRPADGIKFPFCRLQLISVFYFSSAILLRYYCFTTVVKTAIESCVQLFRNVVFLRSP